MELVVTKIVVLLLLGVLRLFFGLLPLKIIRYLQTWGQEGAKRRKQVDVATTLCLCFGGGVLLATCFIHMIPEVRESLEEVKRAGLHVVPVNSTFPLAELLICVGFFIVFLLEEVVHFVINRTKQSAAVSSDADVRRHDASTNGQAEFVSNVHSIKVTPVTIHNHDVREVDKTLPTNLQPHVADVNGSPLVVNMRNMMVVIALSFHSVFEGMAIGVQQTKSDVWYLFAAVGIHAAAILFCIGLEMATSGSKLVNIVVHMVILALVSPLGVGIGILVTIASASGSVVQTLVVAVLQGLAGGTILYITFFEVLDREKKKGVCCGIVRILFIILGFSVMVALQIFGSHDHVDSDLQKTETRNSTATQSHHHQHVT